MALRIGIEAQRIFREKKHGMDFVALEMIRGLQAVDQINEYVVFVKPDKDRCLEPSKNFKIVEVPGNTYPYWEQVMLPGAAKAEQVNLLHCTSNTAPIQSAIPFVVTLHDIIYMEKSPFKGGSMYQKFGNLYRRWVVPRIIEKAEKVITVSQYEKDVILNKFPQLESKLEVIYNGKSSHFNDGYSTEEIEKVLAKYNLPGAFLFFLGNTDPKKNLPGVVEAYLGYRGKTENPLPLVIGDYQRSDLKNVLGRLGVSDSIEHFILPGYIPNKDLPLIYNAAAVFLYPSLRESFGIPIIEAMACGAPVITSKSASMPEVSGGAALLVNPNKPEEISNAILQICNDADLKKQLVETGLKRAASFTWAETSAATYRLYQKINES